MTPDTKPTADTAPATPQGAPVSLGDAFGAADDLLDATSPSQPSDDDLAGLLDDAEGLDPANADQGGFDTTAWISDGRTLLGELHRRGAGEAAESLRTLGPVASNDAALALVNLPGPLADAAEAAGLLRDPLAWRMLAQLGEQARNSLNLHSWSNDGMADNNERPAAPSPQDQRQLRAKIHKLRQSEAYRQQGHPMHREAMKAVENLYRAQSGEWSDE